MCRREVNQALRSSSVTGLDCLFLSALTSQHLCSLTQVRVLDRISKKVQREVEWTSTWSEMCCSFALNKTVICLTVQYIRENPFCGVVELLPKGNHGNCPRRSSWVVSDNWAAVSSLTCKWFWDLICNPVEFRKKRSKNSSKNISLHLKVFTVWWTSSSW